MAKKRNSKRATEAERRPSLRDLAPRILAWRAILLGIVVLLTYLSFNSAIVGATRSRYPEFALRFDADDPVALAGAADVALTRSRRPDISAARRLSLLAIGEQGLSPRAMRTLGFIAELEKHGAAAPRMFDLAAKMSRREAATQMWFIEREVGQNDVAGALTHYDIILRTSRSSDALLFPLLAGALSEPQVREQFARYIADDPIWLPAFVHHVLEESGSSHFLANSVIRAGGLPRQESYRPMESRFLDKLATTGHFPMLKRYFLTLEGADPEILSGASLDEKYTEPRFQPLAWQLVQNSAFGASLLDSPGGRQRAALFAASGERGVAARKVLFLEPGSYVFDSRQRVTQPSGGATAFWELKCLEGPSQTAVWRSENILLPRNRSLQVRLTGPQSCRAHSLELEIFGGGDQEGLAFELDNLTLRRVRAADQPSRGQG